MNANGVLLFYQHSSALPETTFSGIIEAQRTFHKNTVERIDGNDGASTPPATVTESLHLVQTGTASEPKITPEPPAEDKKLAQVGMAGPFPLP